jgi:type II secretory pathway component PulF
MRITSILLSSGVSILQVLSLAADGAGNVVVGRIIENIRTSVNEGKGMLAPMKESGIFPPVVIQMVAVGEETGKISELLSHVADYYDEQVEYTISNMVSLIEPILIVILGCGVLLMALGIFLPMWNMMSLFQK